MGWHGTVRYVMPGIICLPQRELCTADELSGCRHVHFKTVSQARLNFRWKVASEAKHRSVAFLSFQIQSYNDFGHCI